MTRINTNVSSLTAQMNLSRTNEQMQSALTRLSTGLRINTGKDDPAGLIASEALRSDITSVGKAISNSQMANQVISTADSALGQMSSLLNDIRGLISEAANTGAMSADQIAANQLQVDSSLQAIDRIAQTTTFQGRKLLDGSLDFTTTAGTGFSTVSDLKIDQANLGTAGSMAVSVDITAAATQASLTTTVATTTPAAKASYVWNLSGGDIYTITASTAGADMNDVSVQVAESASVAAGEALANFDAENKVLHIYVSDAAAGDTLLTKISTALAGTGFSGAVSGAGDGKYTQGTDTPGTLGDTAGGSDAVTGLAGDVVFQLTGDKGSQVFSFEAGTSGTQIRDAVNQMSSATGVSATFVGTTLTFKSSAYGLNSVVAVKTISEGGGGTFDSGLSAHRATGTDIAATVNGYVADGDGNTLSINTPTLAMQATVTDGSSTDFDFTIDGGGALFQLGPDVVSNQQARIGVQAMNSASLGGPSGRLYLLGSGESAALATDATTAASITDEAISKVAGLRGRLGAFQKTTIDSNMNSLKDTLQSLTQAQSTIRDADFAAESANLTRAQILQQSGMQVLALANKAPEAVLSLLR